MASVENDTVIYHVLLFLYVPLIMAFFIMYFYIKLSNPNLNCFFRNVNSKSSCKMMNVTAYIPVTLKSLSSCIFHVPKRLNNNALT